MAQRLGVFGLNFGYVSYEHICPCVNEATKKRRKGFQEVCLSFQVPETTTSVLIRYVGLVQYLALFDQVFIYTNKSVTIFPPKISEVIRLHKLYHRRDARKPSPDIS